ncbi:hypothetical protein BJX70DRAFT_397469 [Aspergillus crustosus]
MALALPPIAKATLQAAVISAGSNVLAQAIAAYRDQFTTSALILSPLSFLWLEGLEARFPGFEAAAAGTADRHRKSGSEQEQEQDQEQESRKEKEKEKEEEKAGRTDKPPLNVRNTVAKIVVDQVLGGAWNTVAFIATMGVLKGNDYEVIKSQIVQDFWPMLLAGLKLWPFVSVLNFTVVPADKRLLVGNFFGVIWGIYLSLMAA